MKQIIAVLGLLLITAGCTTLPAAMFGKGNEPMLENENILQEEVNWETDGITVAGTLTLPAGEGPFPAVLLVAGSGPTDREWNSPLMPGTNGTGRLLANALTEKGYVTLRFDKRVSGPHAKENLPLLEGKLSMQSHLDELRGAIQTLVARPEVDVERLFALTSSEGAIHALNYQAEAKENQFAGLILTGVPGRTMADTMRSQIEAQLAALPDGATIMEHYDESIADFLAGRPVEPSKELPKALRNMILGLTVPANLPFTREFMIADPTELLAGVEAPVLIIIGKKDVQANWVVDGGQLEAAAGNKNTTSFSYPEHANHILKHEPKSLDKLGPMEIQKNYNAKGRVLDSETLEVITTWLHQQAQ